MEVWNNVPLQQSKNSFTIKFTISDISKEVVFILRDIYNSSWREGKLTMFSGGEIYHRRSCQPKAHNNIQIRETNSFLSNLIRHEKIVSMTRAVTWGCRGNQSAVSWARVPAWKPTLSGNGNHKVNLAGDVIVAVRFVRDTHICSGL